MADARVALATALANDGLVGASSRAFAEGLTTLRPVGPHGSRGVRKKVLVRTLPSRLAGATTILPIRWEATGVTGQLFPALDADLCLTRVNDVTSLLSIVGRYALPLGRVGEVIDRTVLVGTAQASVDAFVRELAVNVRNLAASRRRAGALSAGS